MANSAIAAPLSSTSVIDRAKNSTSQAKLSVGWSSSASPRGDDWKPVHTPDAYNTEKDRFNRVVFETVATTALRVEIESQTGFAGGIHELKVE